MSDSSLQKGVVHSVIGLFLACVLVACGGGASEPDTPSTEVATPPVATDPVSNASSGVTQNGLMNYVVYRVNSGATAIETALVPAEVNNPGDGAGQLILDLALDRLTVSTTDTWESVTWPGSFKGLLGLEGNVGLVCDTALAASTEQVGMSHNMTAVTSVDELRGKSFGVYDCAAVDTTVSTDVYKFLDNGTLEDAAGDTLSASDVAALFGVSGLNVDVLNLKLRAYKMEQAGEVRYAMVLLSEEVDTLGNKTVGVELLISSPALR